MKEVVTEAVILLLTHTRVYSKDTTIMRHELGGTRGDVGRGKGGRGGQPGLGVAASDDPAHDA